MAEKFLYSSIKPLLAGGGEETINDCFREEIKKSDHLEISVGFASFYSLKELDKLITQENIKNVCLILGMYFFNGFPKQLHQLALEINKKWQDSGIGEIRLFRSFRYHGKLYCFIKDNQAFSAILGSANLSFLVDTETTRLHQYEIAVFTDSPETLKDSLEHMQELKSKDITENIAILEEQKLLFDIHPSLDKTAEVTKVHPLNQKILQLDRLETSKSLISINIPLVVPTRQEVLTANSLDFSKSALNTGYSKLGNNKNSQSWFDVQLTIDSQEDLPPKEKWFYIVTDDDYLFKARFTGQKTKKLSTFENKEIIGKWIKGRLVNLDLVPHFDFIEEDHKREGIITEEILQQYGGNQVFLEKTNKTKKDGKGVERDIWLLSFPFKFS